MYGFCSYRIRAECHSIILACEILELCRRWLDPAEKDGIEMVEGWDIRHFHNRANNDGSYEHDYVIFTTIL